MGIRGKVFAFCRVHPSVLFVSSLWNCQIRFRKDDERKERGPEGPKKARPDLLFTWALSGRVDGKRKPDPIFSLSVLSAQWLDMALKTSLLNKLVSPDLPCSYF